MKNLSSEGVVFINRQKGSGTRIFLDHKLSEHGIDPARIRGYDREVYTHFEVGLSILSGAATAGIATVAVSKLFGLPFTSLVKESFDMVLPQETFFEEGVQGFIAALKSEEFRKNVEPLGNYDFSESGKIMYASK
jgi:putative molybdopterin biosynthesis protein